MAFRRPIALAVASFAALTIGMAAARLGASESSGRLSVKAASVGIGGKFKAGFWQPVRLTVVAGPAGAKGRLELVVPDGDQSPVVYGNEQLAELDLALGKRPACCCTPRAGRVAAPITVQLREQGRVVWSQDLTPPLISQAILPTQELIVGIGPPIGLDEAVATIRRQPEVALQAATVRSAAELPDRWWGYEGVDASCWRRATRSCSGRLPMRSERHCWSG